MKIIFLSNHNLHPISLSRPAFDIFCGATTLYQVCQHIFKETKIDYLIDDYLMPTTQVKYPRHKAFDKKILILNASLIPSYTHAQSLYQKIAARKTDQNYILQHKQQTLGALLNISNPAHIKKLTNSTIEKYLANFNCKKININWPSFNYLHQLITYNQEILKDNLEFLKNSYRQLRPGVYVGKQVEIAKQISFNVNHGPIIIGDNTQIQSFACLQGPLYIGPNCLIKPGSQIQDSSIGPFSKVGGEIESSIIQGYSNKQHYGFLGHSYLGEWVNIAAGAIVSNLKNTYGHIKMQAQDTHQQFLGCIIGDYSKVSVNTNIFAGKVIGINSLAYGNITNDIPNFTNAGSWLANSVQVPLSVTLKTQKIIFQRRNKRQTPKDINLLKTIYQLTAQERQQQKIAQGQILFI